MTVPVAGQYTWCVDLDDEAIDSLCAMHEDSTSRGALADNLHPLPTLRGHGVGKRLMGEAACRAVAQGITRLYLLMYGANTAAIGSHGTLGGVLVSRDWLGTAGSGHAWVRTYHWPEAEFENLTRSP